MPINSVRSTLLNPHEHEKPGLVYMYEFTIVEKAHVQRLYIFLRSEDRSKKKRGTVSQEIRKRKRKRERRGGDW